MAVGKLVLARAEVEKARELVFSLEAELLNDIGDFDEKVAKLNCARIDYARKLDLLRRKVMKARGNADRFTTMKKVTNISISICYEGEAVKGGCSLLKSVRRSVLVNGIKTYEDEMSPDIFVSCQDPIRKLEEFLVGVGRDKTDENLKRYIRLNQDDEQDNKTNTVDNSSRDSAGCCRQV